MGKKVFNKIIFLDIDGVLNSVASVLFNEKKKDARLRLCPIATSNLKYLLSKNPDAGICVSSNWRKVFGHYKTRKILKQYGIPNYRVVGFTDVTFGTRDRAGEIITWLEDNATDEFVILDDNPYKFAEFDSLKNKFIKINPDTGLTIKDCCEAHIKLGSKEDIYPIMFF